MVQECSEGEEVSSEAPRPTRTRTEHPVLPVTEHKVESLTLPPSPTSKRMHIFGIIKFHLDFFSPANLKGCVL